MIRGLLSRWIGQGINVLEKDDEFDAVSFKVIKSNSHLPTKRKPVELDEDNN